jgi:hypothetical protein
MEVTLRGQRYACEFNVSGSLGLDLHAKIEGCNSHTELRKLVFSRVKLQSLLMKIGNESSMILQDV